MSAISGSASSAQSIGANYLNLLVTQLRHQNPLEPMSNESMTAQLAQISQLEHLERIDNAFQKSLEIAQLNEAADLIGKVVSFMPSGELNAQTSQVDGVEIINGEALLRAGVNLVSLSEIRSISE